MAKLSKISKKRHPQARHAKKNALPVWILVFAAFLVLVVIASVIHQKATQPECKAQKQKDRIALVENLAFSNQSGREILSFNLRNGYSEPAECIASFSVGNFTSRFSTGIVRPESSKAIRHFVFMPNGNFSYRLSTGCVWKSVNVTGCDATTFMICELYRKVPDIAQCLNRDIPDQYFCSAIIRNNASLCDYILHDAKRVRCNAFVQSRPELCENLGIAWKDWCYQDYGINRQDAAVCEKIQDPGKKSSCLGVVTRDIELCRDISEADKLQCVLNLAEFTGNKALCDMMLDRQACIDKLGWMS
jgi:hypothetical protein